MLEVVLRRLVQQGYARLSVSAVAEELGIGKPTIYLRWHSKAALAAAALATVEARLPAPLKLSGNLRADLIAALKAMRTQFEVTGVGLTGALWSEEHEHPQLMATYRERVVYPTRRLFRSVLKAAIGRGELPADTKIEAAIHILIGSLYAAFIAAEQDRLEVDAIVDTVLDGLRAER